MRGCYVIYMNIVPQARAVRCGIIAPEDVENVTLSNGCLQELGNDVGFRTMILADPSGGTTGVEVAENNHGPSIGFHIPVEHTLERQFTFAVGVYGMFWVVFLDRR